eukprot:SAG31_NODE_6949_length_1838_cov_2.565842_1_plen_49_part_10
MLRQRSKATLGAGAEPYFVMAQNAPTSASLQQLVNRSYYYPIILYYIII